MPEYEKLPSALLVITSEGGTYDSTHFYKHYGDRNKICNKLTFEADALIRRPLRPALGPSHITFSVK